MKTLQTFLAIFLAALGLAKADTKPSILFAVPKENRYAYVGFDYMREVAKAGFAVDYVEGAQAFTWDLVKKYNVIVVLDFPAANAELRPFSQFDPTEAGRLNDYFSVLNKFHAAGGGILLHYSSGEGGGAPNQLLKPWGIQFPLMALHDTRIEHLTNLGYVNQVAFTDQVLPSPVSEGVKQIWYPIDGPHYATWHTMPVLVDSSWQPVVRASKTAWTEVPYYDKKGFQPAPGALIPSEPIKDPILFAIRDDTTAGRLAAIQTWHQFSIGSGMKWSYNNEVLEKGLAGQPSQYGRLLLNTYRWLAEPSLKSSAVGGYVQDPNRMLEPQGKPDSLAQFHEWNYQDDKEKQPPSTGKIFRGLIGAQTSLSGGEGTVEDYAKAAAEAGLDYLVILEDFSQMTPEKLDQLKEAVKKASTPTLRIYAGYRLKNNVGNYMCIYGLNPPWPPARLLVGPHHDVFNLQYQDEQGKYAAAGTPLSFLLDLGIEADVDKSTVGYYNFKRSGPSAMQMHDLRAFGAAAVRTYEGGKLVEDMTDDYLTTWESTCGPTPISMNLVRSPQELREAVTNHESLTYAKARSLDLLWNEALRWLSLYDGPDIFISNGPIVEKWPKTLRSMTFGAEPFVTGRSLQDAPLEVTSTVGLKEIRIYDGQELFRRFLCHGAKEFKEELFFPAVIHRSLVLVAEDINGGSAVTYPLCDYKEGVKGPLFCADHVNDCTNVLLAHGPVWAQFPFTPLVPDAGQSWDGGAPAKRALLEFGCTSPQLQTASERLEWNGQMPYQTPLLEFADEGATRCRMVCDRRLPKELETLVSNPWFGYGPVEPTELANAWVSHTLFDQYTTGVDPMQYGAPGFDRGPLACLFTQQITFKVNETINRCLLFDAYGRSPHLPASVQFAIGHGNQILDNVDLSAVSDTAQTFRFETGDWFAFYSGLPSNTNLVINRGPAVELHLPIGGQWLQIFGYFDKKKVKPGETYDTELFGMTWPMDEKFSSAGSLAQVVTYLTHPTGMQLTRGKIAPGPGGLLELIPENYAVELSIPKSPMPVVVPVRVSGFNKRWSVGLYQIDGYRTHYYSKGNSGYRALGLDFDGRAYFPMHVSVAPLTHDLVGHPVVADEAGKDLFIQVTCLSNNEDKSPPTWHVSVNNPTDHPIETTLRKVMDLPGLVLSDIRISLKPGEYRVLSSAAAPPVKTTAKVPPSGHVASVAN